LLNFFERKESGSGIAFATGTWHTNCYLESVNHNGSVPATRLLGLDLFLMGLGVIVNGGKARSLFHNVGHSIDVLGSDIVIHIHTLPEP
jgi:hypothetical protein